MEKVKEVGKMYKVPCVENCNEKPGCPCCSGKGYNIVVFINGRRVK